MADPTPDFLKLIRVLIEHDVDFIIVGGVCAVLQGVPVTTGDLDIVPLIRHTLEATRRRK